MESAAPLRCGTVGCFMLRAPIGRTRYGLSEHRLLPALVQQLSRRWSPAYLAGNLWSNAAGNAGIVSGHTGQKKRWCLWVLISKTSVNVNTLPSDYKNKALRYLDIFKENPEVVSEYLNTLKKFGNEKAAKEAGADNILFYPNKVLKHVSKQPERFN